MKSQSFTAADLQTGKEYKVIEEFLDFDGSTHEVGDRWTFLKKNFVPHDDGLSLFVAVQGIEKQIRLQWREDQQLAIIEAFSKYVTPSANQSQ
jgi:hypothetical protein